MDGESAEAIVGELSVLPIVAVSTVAIVLLSSSGFFVRFFDLDFAGVVTVEWHPGMRKCEAYMFGEPEEEKTALALLVTDLSEKSRVSSATSAV